MYSTVRSCHAPTLQCTLCGSTTLSFMAGFENFGTRNNLEQLLINFANETLQADFNRQVGANHYCKSFHVGWHASICIHSKKGAHRHREVRNGACRTVAQQYLKGHRCCMLRTTQHGSLCTAARVLSRQRIKNNRHVKLVTFCFCVYMRVRDKTARVHDKTVRHVLHGEWYPGVSRRAMQRVLQYPAVEVFPRQAICVVAMSKLTIRTQTSLQVTRVVDMTLALRCWHALIVDKF